MTDQVTSGSALAPGSENPVAAPTQASAHRPILTADRTDQAVATRRIMLPVDDTDDSEIAIKWAIDAVYRPGDVFHLIHVVPEPTLVHVWGSMYVPPDDDAEMREIEDSKTMVTHRFAEHLVNAKVPFKLHVIVGPVDTDSVAKVVLNKAQDLGAVLIVVARHSKGAIAGLWVGSVTSSLVKKSTCPVVVVPHPPPEATA